MLVKELAQGMQQMMTDGLAELPIIAVLADGSHHPILKLVVQRGEQEYEPNQVNPAAEPQVILG